MVKRVRFADLGSCFVGGRTVFDAVYPELIEVGRDCILADCTILTHDSLGAVSDGYVRIGRVIIGDRVAIGYGAVLLPGVSVGAWSIVGAGSVVKGGTVIPSGEVWAGNPAVRLMSMDTYIQRRIGYRTATGHFTADAVTLARELAPGGTVLVRHGRWKQENE